MRNHKRPFYRVHLVFDPNEEWQLSLESSLELACKLSERLKVKEMAAELLSELSKFDECRHVVTVTRTFGFDVQHLMPELIKDFNEDEITFPDAHSVTVTVDSRGAMPYAERNVASVLDNALHRAEGAYIRATSSTLREAFARVVAIRDSRK